MNRYLLDTNVVSELRKPRPHGAVVAWLNNQPEERLFLSAVTMGELQAGIELTRRQDPSKASAIELWLDKLAVSYQILPMDTPCFREWGRIMDRKPDRLLEDAMIAATALLTRRYRASRPNRAMRSGEVSVRARFCRLASLRSVMSRARPRTLITTPLESTSGRSRTA